MTDILFLDLARKTGWARGVAGEKPASGSIDLGEPGDGGLIVGALGAWLVEHRRAHGVPDLVGIERWMLNPKMLQIKQIESSLRLNGAVHAIMGGVYHVRIVELAAATIRKAVCGQANAGDRKATKAMVCRTMTLRGLLPAGSADDDRGDALAGWVYCESVYGRSAPREFMLA